MRSLGLATVAMFAATVYANAASVRDDRYFVAWGATSLDVTRAMRCAPPLGCRRTHKRHRKVVAQRRSLVRHSAPARAPGRSNAIRLTHATPAILGGRPAGCPRRFCGCALSLKLFGRIIPKLNLAANWLAFPRAAPEPGKVAARRGHVFQLLAHIRDRRWRVWDPNSGHGRIRIHERSIAGYAIVNPGGSVMSARRHRRRG